MNPTGTPPPAPNPFPPPPAYLPQDLRREEPIGVTGAASAYSLVKGLGLFLIPLTILAAWGYQAGPLVEPVAAGSTLTVEGVDHQLVMTVPMDCDESKDDPANRTLTCVDGPRTLTLTVRPHETIQDLDLAARRGVRAVTLSPSALDVPVTVVDIPGAQARFAQGEGLLASPAQVVTVQPDGEQAGFTVSVEELIDIPFEADNPDHYHPRLDEIATKVFDSLQVEAIADDTDTDEGKDAEAADKADDKADAMDKKAATAHQRAKELS